MADSSDSVVSNNTNNCKDLSAVPSSDKIDENKTDKVMEPILVEDYKYNNEPQSVKNVLVFLKNLDPSSGRNDILICLIYILVMETGFITKEDFEESEILSHSFNYQNVKKFSSKLPVGWKSHNMYSFSFVLPPFPQEEIKLACIVTAGDILVNCIVRDIEEAQYTLCLDPLLYFASSRCDINNYNLQNVKHLSRNIKNCIANQAKQAILNHNGIVSECFEKLPPEILLQVMSYLDVKSLINVGQVNSVCNTVMKTPKLWTNLLLHDFPACQQTVNSIKEVTYDILRKIYMKQYLAKKNAVSRTQSVYLFNLFDFNL